MAKRKKPADQPEETPRRFEEVSVPKVDTSIARNLPDAGNIVLPHHLTFTSVWQTVSKTYRSQTADVARRESRYNAIAMGLDPHMKGLLRSRQRPVALLDYSIEVEDPDQPEQKKVGETLRRCVDAIPRMTQLKRCLLDASWFGKAGVQLQWDYVNIMGKPMLIPKNHWPVHGDKIVHTWINDDGGVPGILVNSQFKEMNPTADIRQVDLGQALFLSDPYYRDQFIIHTFEPTDTDYMFQSDMAGMVFGEGLRSQVFYVWSLKQEVMHWAFDSLQRLGTNGMLIGRYESGNENAQKVILEVLKNLTDTSVTAFPVNYENPTFKDIERIEPSVVSYDVLMQFITYFDDIITHLFIGQTLTSDTAPTGMGSGVADAHENTMSQVIRYDAALLSDTLTSDLLGPIIRFNYGELPFSVRMRLVVDQPNTKDLMVSAKALYDMDVPLDKNDLREKAGFTAPRSDADTIQRPDPVTDFRISDDGKTGDNRPHTGLED